MYLSRDRKHVIATMTTIHASVSGLTTRIENFLAHTLYMNSFLSPPDLFDDLHIRP
jgi:hypothetical protein